MSGTILTLNCIENDNDFIELYVTDEGDLNIETFGESHMVLLDVKNAKKLKKALKKYIKSQEEN